MKVLFVVNNHYATGNGLSASCRRTVEYLRKAGVEVRVLSGRNHEAETPQPDYVLKDFYFPVFEKLIESHGYQFAAAEKNIIMEAVGWADLVHLEEPFGLQRRVAKICRKMHKPMTATYHLHPENLFCSIHMGWFSPLNHACMLLWRNGAYDYCSDIQCPTNHVVARARSWNFKARLHHISNGIIPEVYKRKDDDTDRPFQVVCIGRLAVEKDPWTLIKAMRYSKHADKIQLYFAGRGPEAESVRKAADAIYEEGIVKYKPIFGYHTREELSALSARSDVYVHCATIEVEGLSCLESLEQGTVPVIAKAHFSGTDQFALDRRSLFKAGDAKGLARKIDYWYEHPKELHEMAAKYAASTKEYDISQSIEQLIGMFEMAINE